MLLGLLGAVEASCAPEHGSADGVVETEHLRLTTTTGNSICAGTPIFLEEELSRIATALELPLWSVNDKLDVRFGTDAVAEVCSNIEIDNVNGCLHSTNDGLILAANELTSYTPHELVHAVRRRQLHLGPLLFEEGLAQILSGSDGYPLHVQYPRGAPWPGPVEQLEVPRVDFDLGHYLSAQSFVSSLWLTHGRSTLMALMNDPSFSDAETVPALFEHHYGLSLAEAEQEWRAEDGPDPVWGAPCIPEHTYSLGDGPLELVGDFDCDEPTVLGSAYGMALWPMCLDVPQTTRVRLSLDADHGRLQVLLREPCAPGPVGAEALRSKSVHAGDVLEEDIAACRYRMLLMSQEPGFPPTRYTIRIEEALD